jgi:Family of unknown function (DUF6640)
MVRTGKGRQVLVSDAALTLVGGFLAGWNRTQLLNPNWPPHAEYHDAQTIPLGPLLGVSGLYFLRRRGKDPERDLALGALLSSLFWIAQGVSFAFPGAEGFEFEFPEKVPRIRDVWINEGFSSVLMLALITIGYVVERSNLNES